MFSLLAIVVPILSSAAGSDDCSLIQTSVHSLEVQQHKNSIASKTSTKGNSLVDLGLAFQVSSDADSHIDQERVVAKENASTLHSNSSLLPTNPIEFIKHLGEKAAIDVWKAFIIYAMYAWVTIVILALLVYLCCFHSYPKYLPYNDEPAVTLMRHHFSCFDTPYICCCAFFCPILQWADTMSISGYMSRIAGIMVFAFCAALNGLTMTGMLWYGAFTSLLMIIYRQRIRERFGLKSWTCENCLIDFFYVCCCSCCAIAQEAQAMRYAQQKQSAYPYSLDRGFQASSPRPTGRVPVSTYIQAAPSVAYSSRPGSGNQVFTPSTVPFEPVTVSRLPIIRR